MFRNLQGPRPNPRRTHFIGAKAKLSVVLLLVPLLAGVGCSSIIAIPLFDGAPGGDNGARPVASGAASIAALTAGRERPWLESWRIADKVGGLSDRYSSADAIIPIDSGNTSLGMDAERRIAKIARQMKEDGRILLRLESYVPAAGSSALSLGIAERAVQQVKTRLVDLRVSPRRILMSPFGEQHRIAAEFRSGWVELHLIRPSYSARTD